MNYKKIAKTEEARKELTGYWKRWGIPDKRWITNDFSSSSSKWPDQVVLDNYYTNQPITIPLDKALTPSQNAQKYFKRYQKFKEAVKYLTDLIEETKATILYLESVERSSTKLD